ncbi:MAG: class I SAM-dependent methyltransferase [Anaerobutyricum soehngenii]|uniref:class I SAM-dependent methyltransferase n=1 Tax=Waltera sp. TaxID=2815806 RepID=UPI001D0645C6|nr:class I SAM-dependent methyltransferase [Lacrimispora saccharolytica]MCG4782133.1 class I SAM-dependent methyltransferase [Acetatifactor sp. DFI.5.50]
MKKLYRKCPICGSEYGRAIRIIKMMLPKGVPLPNEYMVVACGKCGFSFADVNAKQADYDLYYKNFNMYSSSSELKNEIIHKLCEMRYKLIKKYIKKDQRILDMGCGDGAFLSFLKDHGYTKIYGVDPSRESIDVLHKRGIDGKIGNVFEKEPDDLRGAFDVVTFTAVIEHIYDLDNIVERLSAYLKNTGKIFVDVPAVEGFERCITPVPNYFNQEHINYFSLRSLDNLFLKSNYTRISTPIEAYEPIKNINQNEPELCIQALYQRSLLSMQKQFEVDDMAYRSICNYFKAIDEKNKEIIDKLNNIFDEYESVVVWGTGSYTMQMLAEIPQLQEKIAYFVDNNCMKQGEKLAGKDIFSPMRLLQDKNKYPILICSMLNSKDIVLQINELGLSNVYMEIN